MENRLDSEPRRTVRVYFPEGPRDVMPSGWSVIEQGARPQPFFDSFDVIETVDGRYYYQVPR